ncbi:MAG: chemotaxis protein CheR [Epulopiscium sp. Nele67-Bin001]|nr:MAG: chemotaxis protein CheR [Epulopiscium sp. Nuni2H_MBin001]OON93824.1 MAG: chemotaxis protein CheR [Epulopiscium sp. Nele67-Bin001]
MDYKQFVNEFFAFSKLDLNAYKESQMKRRIDSHIKKTSANNYAQFLQFLKGNPKAYEEFLSYITINVSEFFRDPKQWAILEKDILPKTIDPNKTFNVWSAACSTGDEPYTLAMLLSKLIPTNKFKIIATDYDKEILKKARQGVYPEKQLLHLPEDYKRKYFTKSGDKYTITAAIKRNIEFKHHNLLKDAYPQNMDLIVCRNVLIYFTEPAKAEIYQKFSNSLNKTGTLFVGSTEQIITPSQFGLSSNKIFFYNKI